MATCTPPPIRLYIGPDKLVAVLWSRIDDLRLANDTSLPLPTAGSTIRWVANGLQEVNPAVGASIKSVTLGQGELSIEGRPIEIWTRLLIRLDVGWLEIFNALGENGHAFDSERTEGSCIPCLGPA